MNIDKNSANANPRPNRASHGATPAKLLPWLSCAVLLTACAHRYDMTLTNGSRITNVSKPEFHKEEGAYYYKDVTGRIHHVNSGHVVEITSHSGKNTTPGTVQ